MKATELGAVLMDTLTDGELPTNWDYEAVATDKEISYAKQTELLMIAAGYSGTYAGGSRSKGNGFWLRDDLGNSLGYNNCRSIRRMIKSRNNMLTQQYLNELKDKLERVEKINLNNIINNVDVLQSSELLIKIRIMSRIVRQTSYAGSSAYLNSLTSLKCIYAQPYTKVHVHTFWENKTDNLEKEATYAISMLLLSEAGELEIEQYMLKPLLRLLDS